MEAASSSSALTSSGGSSPLAGLPRLPSGLGLAARHVVEVAGPAAYGAAALLALVGPDAHDDALGLDARAQDDRAGQTEGEK